MERSRRLPAVLATLALAAVVAACGGSGASGATPAPTATATAGGPASATPDPESTSTVSIPVAGAPPVAGTPWYLTIGDSITSGFTVDPSRAGVNASWALQLQGLLAAAGRPWRLYDVACPGERTDTYRSLCPGRAQVPFLQAASQHDVALAAIHGHVADLRAILIDLGSNDLLRALRTGETPAQASAALRTALTAIVTEIEASAPGVPVILANYYNPLANALPVTQGLIQSINLLVASLASSLHARLADFFDAVNAPPTGRQDPHLCEWVDCAHQDVHPTVAGHARLARAALAALA